MVQYILCFSTKLCAPTTYRRLDANVLTTFIYHASPVRGTGTDLFSGLVLKLVHGIGTDMFSGMVISPYKNNEYCKEFNRRTDEAMRQSS